MKNKHGRNHCKKIAKKPVFKRKRGQDIQYKDWLFAQSRRIRLEWLGSYKFYKFNHKYI